MKILFLILIKINLIYLNKKIINGLDIKIKKSDDITCKKDILKIFNINSLELGLKIKSKQFCNNEYNCCSNHEYFRLYKEWKEKTSLKVIKYYEKYLKILKIILQNLDLIKYISNSIKFDKIKDLEFKEKCIIYSKRSNNILKLIEDKEEIFFDIYKKIFNYLAILRKSLFCLLCNQENSFYFSKNINNEIEININTKSIIKIINDIKNYMKIKLFVVDPLLYNTNFIYNCFLNKNDKNIKISFKKIKFNYVKNCLFNNINCNKLLNDFSLFKIDSIIEGNINDLFNTYKKLYKISNKLDYKVNDIDFEENDYNKNLIDTNSLIINFKINSDGIDLLKNVNYNNFYLPINSKYNYKYEDYIIHKKMKLTKNNNKKIKKFVKDKNDKKKETKINNYSEINDLKKDIKNKENDYLYELIIENKFIKIILFYSYFILIN